jgi:peptidoglycan biosynthesis protein MviN/MurJ (putative lipid II flippase)
LRSQIALIAKWKREFGQSLKQTLFSATSLISSLFLQISISYYFGISDQLAEFLSISALPYMVGGVIAGAINYGMLSSFISISQNRQISKESHDSYRFGSFFLFLVLISVLGFGLNSLLFQELNFVNVIVWATSLLIALNGYLLVIFISNEIYSPSSLSGVLLNLITISLLFFAHKNSTLWLSVAYLFGQLSVAIYLLSRARRDGFIRYSSLKFRIRFLAQLKSIFDGTVVTIIFAIVPWFDSLFYLLVSSKTLAEVSYAYKLSTSVASLVAVGPFIVFQRKLTQTFESDENLYHRVLFNLILGTFLVQFLIAILFVVFSVDLLELVYARGAFTLNDVSSVARIFPFYLFGGCYMIGVTLIFRGLFLRSLTVYTRWILLFFVVVYLVGMSTLYYRASSINFAITYMLSWFLVFFLSFVIFFKEKLYNRKLFYAALFFHLLVLIFTFYALIS